MNERKYNRILSVIKLVSISLITQFAVGYIRYLIGIEYSTAISFFLYFLLFFFAENRYAQLSKNVIMLAILFPILAINIPLRVTSFQSSLITLPECSIHVLTVLIARASSSFRTSTRRFFFLASLAILVTIGSFTLYKYWLNYTNYSSFTGKVFEESDIVIQGKDENGEIFSIENQADLWILDFWNTACAACFRAFPEVQKLSDQYENSETVKVLAINIPLKRDKGNIAFDMLVSKEYTFKNIIALDSSLHKRLGITVFPTSLLLDKKGNILFRGDVSTIQQRIDEVLKTAK